MKRKLLLCIGASSALIFFISLLFHFHYLDGTFLAKPYNALGFRPKMNTTFSDGIAIKYDPASGIYYAANEILIEFYENVTDVEKKEVVAMMKAKLGDKTEEGHDRLFIPASLSLEELKLLCESLPTKSVCVKAAYVDEGERSG